MIRALIAVAVGLVTWGTLAIVFDMLLRLALPGYMAAEPQFHFSVGMMLARLTFPGGIPSIGAGFVSAWIARGNGRVIAALTLILLALFLPAHYRLWATFPLWYHLTFLGSLILLPLVGARLKSLVVKD